MKKKHTHKICLQLFSWHMKLAEKKLRFPRILNEICVSKWHEHTNSHFVSVCCFFFFGWDRTRTSGAWIGARQEADKIKYIKMSYEAEWEKIIRFYKSDKAMRGNSIPILCITHKHGERERFYWCQATIKSFSTREYQNSIQIEICFIFCRSVHTSYTSHIYLRLLVRFARSGANPMPRKLNFSLKAISCLNWISFRTENVPKDGKFDANDND